MRRQILVGGIYTQADPFVDEDLRPTVVAAGGVDKISAFGQFGE